MEIQKSQKNLCLTYKAIIKALINFHGIKHSWIADRIGMRPDTFSRWYNSEQRTLSMEELNLFCEALKISFDTIENFLRETTNHQLSKNFIFEYVSKSNTHSSNILIQQFGRDGFAKLMLLICDQLTEFSINKKV